MPFERTKYDGLYLSILLGIPGIFIAGSLGLFDGSDGSTSAPAMNINVLRIGGMNVWWFIAFWMLSQCILVHHARRGSKQPDTPGE